MSRLTVGLACADGVHVPIRRALEAAGDVSVVALRAGPAGAPVAGDVARVDVVVVDVASLGEAGYALVEQVMAAHPRPVLALVPGADGAAARRALAAGAVDALPRAADRPPGAADAVALRQRVGLVSGVAVVRRGRGGARPVPVDEGIGGHGGRGVVAIGASTGGPGAVAAVLAGLAGLPATVLLVQHLHEDFVPGFVTWLAALSALPVHTAVPGVRPEPGHVYVAPAGRHLALSPGHVLVLPEHPVTIHRPSVDVLFTSVAQTAGPRSVGVLLTGMGEDGAAGMLAMRTTGALTIAQDEETCAVYGMPRAAVERGAAERVLALPRIAGAVRSAVVGGVAR
ncbi:chemotaxis-specific protein-glutamate methyltransferase CheB [Kineococcus sp. NUM-3379]